MRMAAPDRSEAVAAGTSPETNSRVGQATTTASIAPAASSRRANSSAGRVLPAPGAAEISSEPVAQPPISARARCCQRRSGAEFDEGLIGGTRPGMLNEPPDGREPARTDEEFGASGPGLGGGGPARR